KHLGDAVAEAEEPRIADAKGLEMVGGVEEIGGARAERAVRQGDRLDDTFLGHLTGVTRMRPVDKEGDGPTGAAFGGGDAQPARTIGAGDHLAPPQQLELGRRFRRLDAIGKAAASATAIKTEDQSRPLSAAAAEMRPQAEATVKAVHRRDPLVDEMDHWIPDQRAVGEQPDVAATVGTAIQD